MISANRQFYNDAMLLLLLFSLALFLTPSFGVAHAIILIKKKPNHDGNGTYCSCLIFNLMLDYLKCNAKRVLAKKKWTHLTNREKKNELKAKHTIEFVLYNWLMIWLSCKLNIIKEPFALTSALWIGWQF